MKHEQRIPILVGAAGHRNIEAKDYPAIKQAVKRELEKLRSLCPHSPLALLCSLAEGGDLLCADAAEELGIPLLAALPRAREDYERDFSDAARERFAHHCARAEQLFVVPPAEAAPEEGELRSFQFRQAGIYVAAHCHILLALWDGAPGTHGCGTAETVDFALSGSYTPASGVSVRSESNEAVLHIFTPRGERRGEAGAVSTRGNWDAVREILRRTDEFNQKAAGVSTEDNSRLPEGGGGEAVLARMEAVSRAAGKLSRQYARQYRRVLLLLAVTSSLLTFAFLMYDEAQAIWMILVCGAMLLAARGLRRFAVRSDCHRRYIECRALAECLRVQTYLRYAGSGVQAANLLSWTQQEETAWILDALCALTTGRAPQEKHEIRACWVDAQRDYHRKAAKSAGQKLGASERIVNRALTLSVLLYVFAVGFELLCGGLIFRPRLALGDVELWRTVLKILLGTISAVTLFVANFFGRLSLPRTLSDHEKMARFYARLSAHIEKYGQTEALLAVLAREELTENGNWISYQRDNRPDISL